MKSLRCASVMLGPRATHTLPYLQLQRQGEALCSPTEAPGPRLQAVEGRHLVLGAQACPGHQGAHTQQHMVTTSAHT